MTVALIAAILNVPAGPVAGRPDRTPDTGDAGDFAVMALESVPVPFSAVPVIPQSATPGLAPGDAAPKTTAGIETELPDPGTSPRTTARESQDSTVDGLLSDAAFATLLNGTAAVTIPRPTQDIGPVTVNGNGTGTDRTGPRAAKQSTAQMPGASSIAASHILAEIAPSAPATDRRAAMMDMPSSYGPAEHIPARIMPATAGKAPVADPAPISLVNTGAGKAAEKAPATVPFDRRAPDPAAKASAHVDRSNGTPATAPHSMVLTGITLPDPVAKRAPGPAPHSPDQADGPDNATPVLPPSAHTNQPMQPTRDVMSERRAHVGPPLPLNHVPDRDRSNISASSDNYAVPANTPGPALFQTNQPDPVDLPATTDGPLLTAALSATPGDAPQVGPRTESHIAQHVTRQIAAQITTTHGKPTEILLDPEELGRVRLSLLTSDMAITVVIQAERPETTDLMRRHIDQLAQEFRSIGYQNVSFSFGGEAGRKERQDQTQGSAPDKGEFSEDRPFAQNSPAKVVGPGQLDLRL